MNGRLAKKIRKQQRVAAEESVEAFKMMVRRQGFKRRVVLAWKILWGLV
jgi:hypothetical protein